MSHVRYMLCQPQPYAAIRVNVVDRDHGERGAAGGGQPWGEPRALLSPDASELRLSAQPSISMDGQNIVCFPKRRQGMTYRQRLEAFIESAIELLDELDADPDLEDEPIEPSGEEDDHYPPFAGTL